MTTLTKQEKKILSELRKENEIKKDKKHVETSKKLMFAIMLLVFIVFFMCIFLSLNLKSVELASHTLDRAVIFSTPVLTAIIVKSGFENRQKGKSRDKMIENMMTQGQDIKLGDEDFRNGV